VVYGLKGRSRCISIANCGMEQPLIARYTASASTLILALALTSCGEEPPPVDVNYFTVFEGRGTKQCQNTNGITPEQSGLKLIQQGLDVR